MYQILRVLQFTLSLLYAYYLILLYPFECVILQVIVSLRASLKQYVFSVIVTIHLNSRVLNWSQIVTSIDLLRRGYNLATLFRA